MTVVVKIPKRSKVSMRPVLMKVGNGELGMRNSKKTTKAMGVEALIHATTD